MEWPKCESCAGYGSWKKMEAAGYAWPSQSYGPCSNPVCNDCHGTGEKAALTEAEALEYLLRGGSKCTIAIGIQGIDKYVVSLFGIIESGKTLKDALNAAARAVKERGNG